MTAAPQIRLGTRQSPLAMAQARETRARLCAAHSWDEAQVELIPVLTSGDKIRDRPLAEIGGKALWTRELDIWLAEGRIDAAAHSMKDVETLRPKGLTIAAILPRADVRDVLIGARSVIAIQPGATVGTSSPRRAAQMLNRRPGLIVTAFRGNVATRLAKLAAGEADVTLLAAAGLERLEQTGTGTALDIADWLPAPQQGAIGIECDVADDRTRAMLAAIDHPQSHMCVAAERALLAGLGGTCHSPIAALAILNGDAISLRAELYSADGAERVTGEVEFAANDLAAAENLAMDLLHRATPRIRMLFEGPA